MAKEGDGNENPGHSHPDYVPLSLCMESRAHMETKIDNMKKTIQWTVAIASTLLGLTLSLFQWYLAVNH